MNVLRNLVYDMANPADCAGDLYCPDCSNGSDAVVLCIHGGGWSALDRGSFAGVAEFLCDNGFPVFNIDYRLLGKGPWPLCGDDCLTAAEFLRNSDPPGPPPGSARRLFIVGASAGGHLALMTGLRLPTAAVAGIVSISGIADLVPDMKSTPDRYQSFWSHPPADHEIALASPLSYIRAEQPPILCTHSRFDEVVPWESQYNFAEKCRAIGAPVDFYSYDRKGEGHCIWIPGSQPHRLYADIERKILDFLSPRRSPVNKPAEARACAK